MTEVLIKLIAVNTILLSGVNIEAGQEFTCDDEETLQHLLSSGAAVPLEDPTPEMGGVSDDDDNISDEDVIAELEKIGGVTKVIAQEMLKEGINSIDKVAGLSIEDLEKIKGVGRTTAEKIFNSFEEAEV